MVLAYPKKKVNVKISKLDTKIGIEKIGHIHYSMGGKNCACNEQNFPKKKINI